MPSKKETSALYPIARDIESSLDIKGWFPADYVKIKENVLHLWCEVSSLFVQKIKTLNIILNNW